MKRRYFKPNIISIAYFELTTKSLFSSFSREGTWQKMQCPNLRFDYYKMKDQGGTRQSFVEAEQKVGITKELYAAKFVYQADSEGEGFLLERFRPSPSQLQGFTIEQERGAIYLMTEMIFRAGESLKIPVSTAVVASAVANYFYSRVGLLDYDFRDVVMGALFLACKSEETLRRTYEVSSVCDYIFKVFEGQRMPVKVQVPDSHEYKFMKNKMLEMERIILFELGFEVHRLFDIPHRYIGGLLKSLDRHPRGKQIAQKAWTALNDLYKTNCCLYFPGQVMAAASIHYAFVKLGVKAPTVPWWVLMEANIDSIQALIVELQSLYETSAGNKQSLPLVAAAIDHVGQLHGLVNVLPVNYYRKIELEVNKQLRIRKPPSPSPSPSPVRFQSSRAQEFIEKAQNEVSTEKKKKKKEKKDKKDKSERKQEKEKKEKKEKKDKKEKKQKKKKKHKNKNRSSAHESGRSRSRSREKHKVGRKSSEEAQSSHEPSSRKTPKVESRRQEQQSASKVQQAEQKQVVKEMKVDSAKSLLSQIKGQLNERSKRRQEAKPIDKLSPKAEESEDEDEQLLAELRAKRQKNKGAGQ